MRRLALLAVPALLLPSLMQQEQETATMAEHFDKTMEIQQAVIEGDLELARATAAWMVENQTEEEFSAGSADYLDKMNKAIRTVAEASDLGGAATAVGEMGYACGSCHSSLEEGSSVTMGATVADEEGHMKGHDWAVERLWEGIVAPSDEAWLAGCSALTESALTMGALPEAHPAADNAEELNAKIEAMEKQVHVLGVKAALMSQPEKRAEAYGQILATCADCHTMIGV